VVIRGPRPGLGPDMYLCATWSRPGLEAAGARVVAPAEDKPLGPRIGYVADPDGHMWEIGAFG
jgi:uncharacterized glyoxalase superfamily protein PhnB